MNDNEKQIINFPMISTSLQDVFDNIRNNYRMLFDALGKLQKENAELKMIIKTYNPNKEQ